MKIDFLFFLFAVFFFVSLSYEGYFYIPYEWNYITLEKFLSLFGLLISLIMMNVLKEASEDTQK